MEKQARTTIRSQSAAFVRDIVRKAGEKEEPATPFAAEPDVKKIEEITNRLKDTFGSKKRA